MVFHFVHLPTQPQTNPSESSANMADVNVAFGTELFTHVQKAVCFHLISIEFNTNF